MRKIIALGALSVLLCLFLISCSCATVTGTTDAPTIATIADSSMVPKAGALTMTAHPPPANTFATALSGFMTINQSAGNATSDTTTLMNLMTDGATMTTAGRAAHPLKWWMPNPTSGYHDYTEPSSDGHDAWCFTTTIEEYPLKFGQPGRIEEFLIHHLTGHEFAGV